MRSRYIVINGRRVQTSEVVAEIDNVQIPSEKQNGTRWRGSKTGGEDVEVDRPMHVDDIY